MEKELTEVYCGNGKGKTALAIGQSLRVATQGKSVIVIQFLKGRDQRSLDFLQDVDNLDFKIFRFEKRECCYEDLTEEEKAELAAANHTSNGISVSGINLPWYVQFRATSGEDYQFTNENEANLFKSYEFELWDLRNNTEYEIPDGEYISVTVPVKAGYTYTIEHLLDSGAMETIVPSVEGSTMVFSTHSFSPFGIAGSKALVGEEIEDGSYSSGTTSTATTTPQATAAASTNTGSTSGTTANNASNTASTSANNTSVQASTSENQNSTSDSADQSEADSKGNSVGAVETGDNTPILPFVIIGIAAAVIVAVLVYLKKKK